MPYDIPPLDLENVLEVTHRRWMLRALELAEVAGAAGDVPVGAVVVGPGEVVLAEVGNRREQNQDPTAHAEVLALREAARQLGNWHLNDCTLYVTLEPCPMCAGAIVLSRIGLLVYGTPDPKSGAVRSVLNLPDGPASNHRLAVIAGVLAEPCRQQLQQWFQHRRGEKRRQRPTP